MEKNEITWDEISKIYNEKISQANNLNYLIRDTDLQKGMISELSDFKNKIKGFKLQAIANNDEKGANLLFHFQCALNSFISILEMWISLKNEKYAMAWSFLIDAQEYIAIAIKAADNHFGIEDYASRLNIIEISIFPKWNVYNSCGFIEDGAGKCSICAHDYGACDHVEGLIYMGRLCQRIERKLIELNHAAIVKEPRDRRCIITKFLDEEGVNRDYLTLKILEENIPITPGTLGEMEAIMFNMKTLDVD